MKNKILRYVITFLIGLVFALLIMIMKGLFSCTNQKIAFQILTDSFFVPGVILICFGILVVCANGGTFDMLVYGVKQFFSLFKKDLTKAKHKTFYEYQQAQKEKKTEFWFLIIDGIVLVAISLIFLGIYNNI